MTHSWLSTTVFFSPVVIVDGISQRCIVLLFVCIYFKNEEMYLNFEFKLTSTANVIVIHVIVIHVIKFINHALKPSPWSIVLNNVTLAQ